MNALIAEDHDDMRSLLKNLLSENGFEVQEAANGEDALMILEASSLPFSLLLTDFNMPYMTGLQLIEELLKRKIPIEKIIIYSGMIENEKLLGNILRKHPHIKFISKSTSPAKLLEYIFSYN